MKTIVFPITHVGELSPPLAKLEDAIGDAIAAANDAACERLPNDRTRMHVSAVIDLLYKAHRTLDDTRRLPVNVPARYGIRTSLEANPPLCRNEYIALGYEQYGKASIICNDPNGYLLLNPLGEIVSTHGTLAEARAEADRLEGLASAMVEGELIASSATPIASTDIRKLGSLCYGDRFRISGGNGGVYRRGLYLPGMERRIACHRETPKGLSPADTTFAVTVEVDHLPMIGGMIKLCMLPEGALFKRQPDTTRTYRKGTLAKGKAGPQGKQFIGTDVEVPSFVQHFAIGETVFVPDLV